MPYFQTLPDDTNPTGDICYPLFIPDDPDYVGAVTRLLRNLTLDRHWQRDDANSALLVRDVFDTRTYQPFIESLANGDACASDGVGSLGSCFRLDTTTEAFSFYPNDPFTDKENDAGKILSHTKFARFADLPINEIPLIGDFIENVLGGVSGYFDNDIFITEDVLSPFSNPLERLGDMVSQITSFPLPYVKIELEGAGQLEVELVNVPEGGSVLLIPDLDVSLQSLWDTVVDLVDNDGSLPATWMLTEVNRNIVGFELVATQVQEFEFTEDDVHTMHVIFVPIPKLTPPFINAFGGIREIEVCGSLRIIGTQTGNEINSSNFKQTEMIREGVIAVSTIDDIRAGVHLGIYDVMTDAIKGHGDGVTSNIIDSIVINKNGDVAVDKGSNIPAPTYTTTPDEQRNGASYNQAVQFAKLFTDTDSQISEGFSDNLIIKSLQYVLATVEILVFSIVDYRATASAIVIDVAKLSETIFCTGSFVGGVFEYGNNPANHGATDFEYMLDLAQDIPSSQLQSWYSDGYNQPSIEYKSFACYVYPPVLLVLDATDWDDAGNDARYINTESLLQANRRYRVEISGNLTKDATNNWDGMYREVNSIRSYLPFGIGATSGAKATPTTTPTYDANGYTVIIENVGMRLYASIADITLYSGSFTLNFIDLGSTL